MKSGCDKVSILNKNSIKKYMELLSHRGFWKTADQKNTKEANALSFSNGWGIETDIRDYREELVISHDIATNNDYTLEFLLDSNISHQVQMLH